MTSASQPRPEYPRPQFVRPDWLCLNGTWQFEIDRGDSGLERGLKDRELSGSILVPFAPESEMSGVGDTDFLEAVWYRTTVRIPTEWSGRLPILHFGAVDHDATVWVDGVEVVRHRGGFTPFSAELPHVSAGDEVTIVVRARDSRHTKQPRGKQSMRYESYGCVYTRTTGIWQTVWIEPVPLVRVRRLVVTPLFSAGAFRVTASLSGNPSGAELRVVVSDAVGIVAEGRTPAHLDLAPELTLSLPSDRVRPWSPDDPHLYDLRVELLDSEGAVLDAIASYAGLRSIAIDGRRFLLNGEPVFQRLVLDQGYWPESVLTAPTDDALVRDIQLSLDAGFNGARLHQKVFEERFLYHADRMGYLVWAEFADWDSSSDWSGSSNASRPPTYITQWLEAVERDVNHPSIVGWCPLNESVEPRGDRIGELDDVTRGMFLAVKLADPTRPVLDISGHSHRVPETDVYDSHDYEQDPSEFAKHQAGLADGTPYINEFGPEPVSIGYGGQPYFVSEFGGIWWNPEIAAGGAGEGDSWGYGERVRTEEEFHERFAGLTGVLLGDPEMFGYCYTQLTDVFPEENGIYRFDRSTKLDVDRVRAAQVRPAAYEGPTT